jgi:ribosomal protein S18 acetylase RimI-like enzyme
MKKWWAGPTLRKLQIIEDSMIKYLVLKSDQISQELFRYFDRYQNVKRCWRKENGCWVLKEISFEENWNTEKINDLVNCLKHTATTGGAIFGAFKDGILVGFSSLENEPFGKKQEYLQLSNIHVSYKHRGCGIGKELFRISADRARESGAKKLYISAHSSEETQAFYKSMNCIEALEYNQSLTDAEPYDCQLEYRL